MKRKYKIRNGDGRILGEIKADPYDPDDIARSLEPIVLRVKRAVFGELVEDEKAKPKKHGR